MTVKTTKTISNYDFSSQIEGLINEGKIDDALQRCAILSKENPQNFFVYYYLAVIFDKKNDGTNCIKCVRQAYQNGVVSDAHMENLGHMLYKYGQYTEARKCFENILVKEGHSSFFGLFNIAMTYCCEGEYKESLKYLEMAQSIDKNFHTYFNLGIVYRGLNEYDKARKYFLKASKIDPEDAEPYFGLASLAEYEGNQELTKQYYQKGLSFNPNKSIAYYSLSLLREMGKEQNDNLIHDIKNILSQDNVTNKDRGILNIALGKIYDSAKKYDKAFEYIKKGNDYINVDTKYSSSQMDYMHEVYEQSFSATKRQSFNNDIDIKLKNIFIVGMPRSGTTLTEQLLSSHSKVDTIGESNQFDEVLKNASELIKPHRYPDHIHDLTKEQFVTLSYIYADYAAQKCPQATMVVNKMPDNFYNIGSIITILPNSYIINCKRHPLDICVSAYSIGFEESGLSYSYNLQDLAMRYKQYEKFMTLWHKEYPGLIKDFFYEELVAKPEKSMQELLNFCDLEWEDNCLDFNNKNSTVSTASKWQVRDKIYKSSIFKWKNYEKHIKILQELLQKEIKEYENEINIRISESYD